jgi:glycine/D-amino acid oxidase-like deaminating enzyme
VNISSGAASVDDNVPAWEGPTRLALPPLDGDVDADVCVVGLGGSGLTAVHELLAMGERVVGIDASTVGSGAAGRNGGFLLAGTVRFYHDAVATLGRARACAIYQLTLDEMDRIAEQTPGVVRRVGSLRIASSVEEEADCALQLEPTTAPSIRWRAAVRSRATPSRWARVSSSIPPRSRARRGWCARRTAS